MGSAESKPSHTEAIQKLDVAITALTELKSMLDISPLSKFEGGKSPEPLEDPYENPPEDELELGPPLVGSEEET